MMIKSSTTLRTVSALIANLFVVFVCFTITRVVFMLCNMNLFESHLTWGYALRLLVSGLRFDCTAILYLNCWMILFFLLPLHKKEGWKWYYPTLRVVFVVVNFIGIVANLCDCAYFPFTGRRTTWNVLTEFSNESNIFGIVLKESLPYWYLFPIGILLCYGLWKLFRSPAASEKPVGKGLVGYYISCVILLALASGLTVAGMRGGFTTAVRPITLSNANQYVDHAIDAGIVLNTPFCIMRTIGKKPFSERNYMDEEEALKLFSPLHEASDSTEMKKMNVVVFILESFGQQAMARGCMPFLQRLAKQGATFTYSYACGRKSIDGMPSVLSSIPSLVEPFFLTPAALNDLSGIAGELTRNKGYSSAFFHGAENGSMGFQAFANATGFEKYYGRTEYNQDSRYNGDKDFDGTWAIWDEEFLQFYCDKMGEMTEPFVTSVFTASSHSPFAIPERYREVYPPSEPKVFSCIKYSDNALRLFFEKAQKQPWFKNTLFVLTADHTSEAIDQEFLSDLGVFRVPIVIYSPAMPELAEVDRDKLVSQADIMPTVYGLLRYDKPYIAFGQDALNTPKEDKFILNYHPGSGLYQYVQGDWMLQFDGEKTVHAYRFKEDKLLKKDLNGSQPKEYEKRLKSIIQQYMYRMNHNELVVRQ